MAASIVNKMSVVTVLCLIALGQRVVCAAEQYVHVGEGSLISVEGSSYYGTVTYAGVGSSGAEAQATLAQAADEMGASCVGYMYDSNSNRGGLMFDTSKLGSLSWPPPNAAALASNTRLWNNAATAPLWQGKGIVSLNASVSVGKGWNGWQSYAKLSVIAVTHVGEGTLVSESGKTWYAVMQYKGIADTAEEVQDIMLHAIVEAGDACVGYHFRPITTGGRYLEAALLFDRSMLATWPPAPPASLAHAEESWKSEWTGQGPVSYDLSVAVGKGWSGWQSYAKVEKMVNPAQYVGEGTLLADSGNKYFGVVQYKGLSSTETGLWSVIRRALIECGDVCVGFHYRPVNDGQYLQAALLYDRSKTTTWPAAAPAALSSGSVVWSSPSTDTWSGSGTVSSTASVGAGKGWVGWQSYKTV